jgi:hypothetical protein
MPKPDLARLWEEHTAHEFSTRNAEATLATMVDDAHVNHVPVMTGGCGKDQLRAFYSRDFIPSIPPDTTLTPISRTVGENQLVDEMIFSFTHTQEMPWMLPGIPPTHRGLKSHWLPSWASATANWRTNTSTGTRLPCSRKLGSCQTRDSRFAGGNRSQSGEP